MERSYRRFTQMGNVRYGLIYRRFLTAGDMLGWGYIVRFRFL